MAEINTYLTVENGYNTCYIDSLLICLFYRNNVSINSILENEPKIPEAYYLQELIKVKFVDQIKKNYSIFSETINEIRNYSVICGWLKDGNIDSQQNCILYYDFLVNLLRINTIDFEVFDFENNMISVDTYKLSFPYIKLELNKDNNVKNLFINWINSNIILRNSSTQCYKLMNIPQFIVFSVDRFSSKNKNNSKLDIMKKIKFFGINDSSQSYLKWKIHGIICYDGDNYENGHYYALFVSGKKDWLFFDDLEIPSFKKIDLNNDKIKDKILSESVILIYSIE